MAQSTTQAPAKSSIAKEAAAALKRLKSKDPGLKQFLKNAHAYAVFPSVGKAALVVGGSYGRGVVFQNGEQIGFATIGQLTIGVQVGGDTFTELVVFESKESLERFKKGKTAFSANAAAVMVKAGAAAAADFEKGVAVFAYPQGGMLLELSIGGQRFKFKPGQGGEEQSKASRRSGGADQGEESSESEDSDDQESGDGFLGKMTGGLGSVASRTAEMVKERPVAAALIGTGVVAGLAFAVIRTLRSGGSSSDEGSGDNGNQGEDEPAASGRKSRWS